MTTFGQWLAAQGDRDDQTGWAARYWAKATPGRISSVTGVLRHLETALGDARITHPDDAEAHSQITLAIEGIRAAAADYGQQQLADQAGKAGLLVQFPGAKAPESDAEPSPAAGAGSGVPEPAEPPAAPRSGKYTGWPAERFDRIEGMLERNLERQAQIIELLSALVFPENHAPQAAGDRARPDDPRRAAAAARYLRADGSGFDLAALYGLASA